MGAKLLVTGGTGLLGSALQKICPQAVFLGRRDGDLTEPREVGRLFERHRPERVLHLAAAVGGVKKNAEQNSDLFRENVLINTNVLHAAREAGVSRLISLLSSCVFHLRPDRPSTEEDLHEGLPFEGNLGYGYAKRMLDIQTKLLHEQNRAQFSTFTPVTMYGPHDNWDLEAGHVASALIHKCFLAKREGKPFEVWGTGEAVRQFVFVEDVARLLLQALDCFGGPETVIVAPDSGVSIADLAKLTARLMKFEGPIIFNKNMPEGEKVKVIKSRAFERLFPGFTFTSLEEGLRMTIEWFCVHYEDELIKRRTHSVSF